MAVPDNENERVDVEEFEREPRHRGRVRHPAYDNIERAGLERVHEGTIGRGVQDHPRVRPVLSKVQEGAGQEIWCDRGQRSHSDDDVRLRGDGRETAARAREGVEHRYSVRQKSLALLREARALPAPADHSVTERFFQRRQRLGHGGLRKVQPLGGPSNMSCVRHSDETAKLLQANAVVNPVIHSQKAW
jgi:hypothetical protein